MTSLHHTSLAETHSEYMNRHPNFRTDSSWQPRIWSAILQQNSPHWNLTRRWLTRQCRATHCPTGLSDPLSPFLWHECEMPTSRAWLDPSQQSGTPLLSAVCGLWVARRDAPPLSWRVWIRYRLWMLYSRTKRRYWQNGDRLPRDDASVLEMLAAEPAVIMRLC
ncbi:uncharacterized protein BDW70DRAFT_66196 [Aspergillus foveolatus]|uniref:uncharacterized protein n=1 Tax=Aspergillus foveolatus TaxID=210207 RepID=UPI003CCE5131